MKKAENKKGNSLPVKEPPRNKQKVSLLQSVLTITPKNRVAHSILINIKGGKVGQKKKGQSGSA